MTFQWVETWIFDVAFLKSLPWRIDLHWITKLQKSKRLLIGILHDNNFIRTIHWMLNLVEIIEFSHGIYIKIHCSELNFAEGMIDYLWSSYFTLRLQSYCNFSFVVTYVLKNSLYYQTNPGYEQNYLMEVILPPMLSCWSGYQTRS